MDAVALDGALFGSSHGLLVEVLGRQNLTFPERPNRPSPCTAEDVVGIGIRQRLLDHDAPTFRVDSGKEVPS